MNQHRRRTDHSTYNFQTTTGRGPAKVTVGYEMDSDGDVHDIVVHQLEAGSDITKSIGDEDFDVLTDQCYEHYESVVKEANDDMAIDRFLSRSEA